MLHVSFLPWSSLPGRKKAAVAFVSACLVVNATVFGIIAATGSFWFEAEGGTSYLEKAGSFVGDGSSRPVPDLFFKEFRASPPGGKNATNTRKDITALIIGGVTTNTDHYVGLAKALALKGSNATGLNWHVVAATMRHHGLNSLGYKADGEIAANPSKYPWAGRPDIESAADDVVHLLDAKLGWKVPDIIVAHSMGCKIATSLAHKLQSRYGSLGVAAPGGREMQIWLVDGRTAPIDMENTPGYKEPDSAATMLRRMPEVKRPMANADAFKTWLRKNINNATEFVNGFSNVFFGAGFVIPVDGGFDFFCDVKSTIAMLEDYFFKDTSHYILPSSKGPIYHAVKAGDDVIWNGGEKERKSLESKGHKFHVAERHNHFLPIFLPEVLVDDYMLPELVNAYKA